VEKQQSKSVQYRLLQLFSVALALSYLLWVVFASEIPYDTSDGLQHFAVSYESWKNADYFLSNWGKPLYVLFSSPFAQFGYEAFTLFNVTVFLGTILLLFSVFEHFKIRGIMPLLTPFILLSIPDYTGVIIGGMTEPFFGFLLVLMLWAAIKEKWILFAIVASFIPFARNEGMLILLMAPILLAIFKQWKAIPFVALGFVIYIIAGKIMIDQPMWYFTNDPHPEISPYGKGSWFDYLTRFDRHLGYTALYLLPLMVIGFFMWRQKERKRAIFISLFFFGAYTMIIAAHSYLWANGLKGSFGLTRLATMGMPAAYGLGLVFCGLMLSELHKVTNLIIFAVLFAISISSINQIGFPIKSSPYQKRILEAATYVEANESKIGKVYYLHPLIAYNKGLIALERHPKYVQFYHKLYKDVNDLFHTGDIIIREAQFGGIEQGLPLAELAKYPWIKQVKHYFTDGDLRLPSGEPESVVIYQVFPKNDTLPLSSRYTKTLPVSEKWKTYTSDYEYFELNTDLRIPKLDGARQKLVVNYEIENGTDLHLIFSDNKGTVVSVPLTNAEGIAELYFSTGGKSGLLFIHNPSKKQFKLKLKLHSWEQYSDPGVQSFRK